MDTVRVKGQFTEGHLSGHSWLTGGTEFPANWESEGILSALRNRLKDIDNNNLNVRANKMLEIYKSVGM